MIQLSVFRRVGRENRMRRWAAVFLMQALFLDYKEYMTAEGLFFYEE